MLFSEGGESTAGLRERGMQMLAEVAARYAGQHGLAPTRIGWEAVTEDQLSLVVETDHQSITIPFSVDEVEDFPEGTATAYSKKKIRDKFAGLSM
ncbi:MAG: hypothetical protein IH614_11950 [Desulfuromonadales bacterium]|nr:hypothetical protein [Desulfuromonadales bacterium]